MRKRNFFLFSIISLTILSCSAMEEGYTDLTDLLDSYGLEVTHPDNLFDDKAAARLKKTEFIDLTNTTITITNHLSPLLNDKKNNKLAIADWINKLKNNIQEITKLLTQVSINGTDSARCADLNKVSENIFYKNESKKLNKRNITKLAESIQEVRILSIHPTNGTLTGNSGIYDTSPTSFLAQLHQLKQDKQNKKPIPTESWRKYQTAAEEYINGISETGIELINDINSMIEDTKQLILLKQRTLEIKPKKEKNKNGNEMYAASAALNEKLTREQEEIKQKEAAMKRAAQELEVEVNAQKEVRKQLALQQQLEQIATSVATFKTIPNNDKEFQILFDNIKSIIELQEQNPENQTITDLLGQSIDMLLNQRPLYADQKLKFIDLNLPKDNIIRKNALTTIIECSGDIKATLLQDLNNGHRNSVAGDANNYALLKKDKEIILARLNELRNLDALKKQQQLELRQRELQQQKEAQKKLDQLNASDEKLQEQLKQLAEQTEQYKELLRLRKLQQEEDEKERQKIRDAEEKERANDLKEQQLAHDKRQKEQKEQYARELKLEEEKLVREQIEQDNLTKEVIEKNKYSFAKIATSLWQGVKYLFSPIIALFSFFCL